MVCQLGYVARRDVDVGHGSIELVEVVHFVKLLFCYLGGCLEQQGCPLCEFPNSQSQHWVEKMMMMMLLVLLEMIGFFRCRCWYSSWIVSAREKR